MNVFAELRLFLLVLLFLVLTIFKIVGLLVKIITPSYVQVNYFNPELLILNL